MEQRMKTHHGALLRSIFVHLRAEKFFAEQAVRVFGGFEQFNDTN
jgi:hypothetical protein